MKEYKMIYLNKGVSLSREKDLEKSEAILNQYISEGWTLQQIATPADGIGAMIAIIYRDN